MSGPNPMSPASFGGQDGGARKMTVKQMKKLLKQNGLKTTGKRAALTRRVKKAHLKGGELKDDKIPKGGRGRRRGGAMTKEDAKAALEAAVRDGGDVAKAKADALEAGWTQTEVDGVVAAEEAKKTPAAASSTGGRRRRGSRRGIFGKLF